jgi:Ca2+-transporting ATPase
MRAGEPTEAALKVVAQKLGHPGVCEADTRKQPCCGMERVSTLEFVRKRKSMSVLAVEEGANGSNGRSPPVRVTRSGRAGRSGRGGAKATARLFCKGAPENVIARCSRAALPDGTVVALDASTRRALLETVDDLASRPLRTLALATREGVSPDDPRLSDPDAFADVESDMTFIGLVGIKDPARPEVPKSIRLCYTAGIRVIVITGDKRETAEAIAREIGVFGPNEDITDKSFEGREFMSLPAAEQKRLLGGKDSGSRLFSRTEPKDKKTIVRLLKELGEVPAMTGDGVNDAPALAEASIGIAMGICGTEVAKEASDMVLADDNFATIVDAIEEGRSIYSNMKAFIRYLISSNIGEVASIFLTAALGLPEGLIPVQLLWVNLVTDGPPATALGFNPADADVMRRPPRGRDDMLINRWVFFRYMVVGIYVGFATVAAFAAWYMFDYDGDGHTTVTFSQLRHWGQCPAGEGEFSGFSATLGSGPGAEWAEGVVLRSPCELFTRGKVKASTLSLSVLVTIEMLNALNALSENGSLLQMPPWVNPWLLVAMAVSFGMHFVILYVPALASIFEICPLTANDWWVVMALSVPVCIIDEVLKWVGRRRMEAELAARKSRKLGRGRSFREKVA